MLTQRGEKLLGLIPLMAVTWTTILYVKEGRPDEILWICNVSNFLLGISLLLSWAPGIWASTLWILLGTPLWMLDAAKISNFEVHSFFTHFGSGAIGLLACRNYRAEKRYWWIAGALFVVCQLLARALTRPVYNVNIVYTSYGTQMSYSSYWLLCAWGFGSALFITEWLLQKLLPLKRSA